MLIILHQHRSVTDHAAFCLIIQCFFIWHFYLNPHQYLSNSIFQFFVSSFYIPLSFLILAPSIFLSYFFFFISSLLLKFSFLIFPFFFSTIFYLFLFHFAIHFHLSLFNFFPSYWLILIFLPSALHRVLPWYSSSSFPPLLHSLLFSPFHPNFFFFFSLFPSLLYSFFNQRLHIYFIPQTFPISFAIFFTSSLFPFLFFF